MARDNSFNCMWHCLITPANTCGTSCYNDRWGTAAGSRMSHGNSKARTSSKQPNTPIEGMAAATLHIMTHLIQA